MAGGQEFYVKRISALDRDRFEQQWLEYKPADSVHGIRAFVSVFCLCDSEGKLQHPSGDGKTASDEFIKTVEHAQNLPSELISPLASKALEINKFTGQDVEELEKN